MDEENIVNNNTQEEDIVTIPDEENNIPDAGAKIKKSKDELRVCEKEKKEYLEGWQRARADFLNYKNEEGKRMEDMARFVIVGLIQDILPVLDSFDLAFQYKMTPEMERGVLLIRSQFDEVLKRRGLEEIQVKAGEKFNTEYCESIGEMESAVLEGTVAEVVQKGYLFRGRVLRPARVRLSKTHNT